MGGTNRMKYRQENERTLSWKRSRFGWESWRADILQMCLMQNAKYSIIHIHIYLWYACIYIRVRECERTYPRKQGSWGSGVLGACVPDVFNWPLWCGAEGGFETRHTWTWIQTPSNLCDLSHLTTSECFFWKPLPRFKKITNVMKIIGTKASSWWLASSPPTILLHFFPILKESQLSQLFCLWDSYSLRWWWLKRDDTLLPFLLSSCREAKYFHHHHHITLAPPLPLASTLELGSATVKEPWLGPGVSWRIFICLISFNLYNKSLKKVVSSDNAET